MGKSRRAAGGDSADSKQSSGADCRNAVDLLGNGFMSSMICGFSAEESSFDLALEQAVVSGGLAGATSHVPRSRPPVVESPQRTLDSAAKAQLAPHPPSVDATVRQPLPGPFKKPDYGGNIFSEVTGKDPFAALGPDPRTARLVAHEQNLRSRRDFKGLRNAPAPAGPVSAPAPEMEQLDFFDRMKTPEPSVYYDSPVLKKAPPSTAPLDVDLSGPDPRTTKLEAHARHRAFEFERGLMKKEALAVERPPQPGVMSDLMGVADMAIGGIQAVRHTATLMDDKATLDQKGNAAGSLPGDAMAVGGGVATLASSPLAPILSAGAAGNALARAGDDRMGRSLEDGGFGQTGSDWAAEVGVDVAEGLGGGTAASVAGALACGGASVAATVPAIGQGVMATGEGLGDLACVVSDCDETYGDAVADWKRGQASRDPMAPELVAARRSAAGTCAGESDYDVDHFVATGQTAKPSARPAVPEGGSSRQGLEDLGDPARLTGDPSKELPGVAAPSEAQVDQLADWLNKAR